MPSRRLSPEYGGDHVLVGLGHPRQQVAGEVHPAAALPLHANPLFEVAPGHAAITVTSNGYKHLVGTVESDAVTGAANLIAHTVPTPESASAS